MKLETKMRLVKFKKLLIKEWYKLVTPLAKLENKIIAYSNLRYRTKIDKITEDELIDRLVKNIEKKIAGYSKWWEEFHICAYGEYPDRTIIEYCRECSGDKIIKSCSYKYTYRDLESCKRLTEKLYDNLKDHKVIDAEWKVFDGCESFGNYTYTKTLCVHVKDKFK